MTDAESRALVATQVLREARAIVKGHRVLVGDGERLATAFAAFSSRVIDIYLSHLFTESKKEIPS